MKRIVGMIMALLVLSVGSTLMFAEETRKAEKDYPWLVAGLKKFNAPRFQEVVVATTKGGSSYSCKDEPLASFRFADDKDFKPGIESWKNSEDCRIVELELVTVDGEYLSAKVALGKLEMAFFHHELSPDFGKYEFWQPVLTIYLKEKDLLGFGTPAIRMVGRFIIDTENYDNYEEERFVPRWIR